MNIWLDHDLSRVNVFLGKAQAQGISDIHINPAPEHYRIRVRQQGEMRDSQHVTADMGRALVQRIKAQAQMNLAESRCPQDGRIDAHLPLHREVRVACHPTIHGENMVIRLFAPQQLRRVDQLGIGPETQRRLMSGIETEEGLILVCGPTGAGKTSTLHALLNDIGAIGCNLMTLEDPVEIVLQGALQSDLSQLPKMNFAQGLRSLLRQDPDVMLVGEIRDRETAELAIEAAMTGHLVLASLHAADTSGAMARLDMLGLGARRVMPHLRNLICQRLVRNSQGKRVPVMQIWSPQANADEEIQGSGGLPEGDRPTPMNAASLWTYRQCFEESVRHGLLDSHNRPGWIRLSGVGPQLQESYP